MMNSRHGLHRNTKPLLATGVQSLNPPILSSPPLIQNPRHPQFRRTLDFRRTNLSSPAPQSRRMDLAGTRRGRHWPPDRHCGERPRCVWERIETRGIETRKGSCHLCFRSARGCAGVAMAMRPIRPAAAVAPVGLHALLQLPGGGRQGRLSRGAVACTGGGIRVLHAGTGAAGCCDGGGERWWWWCEVAGCSWVGLGVLVLLLRPFSVPSRLYLFSRLLHSLPSCFVFFCSVLVFLVAICNCTSMASLSFTIKLNSASILLYNQFSSINKRTKYNKILEGDMNEQASNVSRIRLEY
jgi:hypothetical protein